MIHSYFSKVQKKLETIKWLFIEHTIHFDFVSDDMGIIIGKIIFIDNSTLEFMELVSLQKSEYRFQYMGKDKELISRWDSAPHHPEISTFPYHLHTKKGVQASERLNFIDVLDIVAEKVIENLDL